MTDAEAKKALEIEVRVQSRGCEADIVSALRHALQAIEDRAALVGAWDDEVGITWAVPRLKAAGAAARRHMRGEP